MKPIALIAWAFTILVGGPIALFAHQYAPILGMGFGSFLYTAMWVSIG